MKRSIRIRLLMGCELFSVGVIPVLLLASAALQIEQTALLSLVVILVAMFPFFLRFELSKPRPRDIVPVVVMSVIAALGRVLFAAVPSFKPTSAVVIVTALSFGPQAGFLTGALATLGSNLFLGMGAWTPWQMYAWGMIGYIAGLLNRVGAFRNKRWVYVYGFISSYLFGVVMNLWYIVGFVKPITAQTVAVAYLASIPFDLTHAVSTVIFLLPILTAWTKKLRRIKQKYGIAQELDDDEKIQESVK